MASNTLVLYDICSRAPNRCWSSNTWKVRLILNYKGIPYRTEWVEYADIQSTIKALFVDFYNRLPSHCRSLLFSGVPPNASGPEYTLPTVTFPDGKTVMDSVAIAAELEQRHPSPPVVLSDPRKEEWTRLHINLARPVRWLIAARAVGIVTDYSRPKKLAELDGRSVEEVEASVDLEQVRQEREAPLQEMSAFWQPLPKELTWTAVYQLSALKYVSMVAPDIFESTMAADGLRELYAWAEKAGWLERDDH